MQRFLAMGIPVSTLIYLAGGLRVDDFEEALLPSVKDRKVDRLTNFVLSHERELQDSCGINGIDVYHKSLLYLVSRSFETGRRDQFQVPLVGLERATTKSGDQLIDALSEVGEQTVVSPKVSGADPMRSDARRHGDFDDDSPTMTSVVMQILRILEPMPEQSYRPHAALDPAVVPPARGPGPAGAGVREPEAAEKAAAVAPPGEEPLIEMAEAQEEMPRAAPMTQQAVAPEVAVAPQSGSPTADMLEAEGWVEEVEAQ